MLSINAVKGFEIGSGFSAASMKGSEHNDIFDDNGKPRQLFRWNTRWYFNGMPIVFRVGFACCHHNEKSRFDRQGRQQSCD